MAQTISHHTVARDVGDLMAVLGTVPTGGYLAYITREGHAREFAKTTDGRYSLAGSYLVPFEPYKVHEMAKTLAALAKSFGVAQSPDSTISTWAKAYTFTTELTDESPQGQP